MSVHRKNVVLMVRVAIIVSAFHLSSFCDIKTVCTSCNCGPTLDAGGKCYALLVGLNKYNFNANGDGDLRYPEAEVEKMADFLCGQNFIVRSITGREATVKNIRNEIQRLSSQADSASRILFYFSGHGKLARDSTFAIVARRTENDTFADSICLSADTVAHMLATSAAHQKVLLIDACYSGGTRPPPVPVVGANCYKLSRHAFFSLTTWNDTTWDNFFTPELLAGMARGADEYGDKNGYVDAGELCKYVDKHIVKKIIRKTGENRRPVVVLIGAAGNLELFKVHKKKRKNR